MSNESEKAQVEGTGRGQLTTASLSDESLTNPTGINEKALLWKLDLRLLPPLTLLYLLSFLDRSNSASSFPAHFTKNQMLIEMSSW